MQMCYGLLFVMWCQQQAPPVTAGATFCQIVRQQDVMWSAKDTRTTKENLDRVFRKGRRLCGWGKS